MGEPILDSAHIADLPVGHGDRLLSTPWGDKVDFTFSNYARWIKEVSTGLVWFDFRAAAHS